MGCQVWARVPCILKLAHDKALRRRHRDGILYVAPGPEPDLVSLLGAWGAQLRIASADAANALDADGWTLALHQAIGERRMLVIIYDVWQIEHFNSLKVGGSNCDYLITTRSPRLASEIAGADAIAVDELTDTDGFELLA